MRCWVNRNPSRSPEEQKSALQMGKTGVKYKKHKRIKNALMRRVRCGRYQREAP